MSLDSTKCTDVQFSLCFLILWLTLSNKYCEEQGESRRLLAWEKSITLWFDGFCVETHLLPESESCAERPTKVQRKKEIQDGCCFIFFFFIISVQQSVFINESVPAMVRIHVVGYT